MTGRKSITGLWLFFVTGLALWLPLPAPEVAQRTLKPAAELATELPSVAQNPSATALAIAPDVASSANPKTGHAEVPPPRPSSMAPVMGLPRAALEELAPAKTTILNGREVKMLRARAVPKANYLPAMGSVLFEQNGFLVIESKGEFSAEMIVRETDRPVLLDTASGRPSIVSGTLVVHLKDMRAADLLAGRFGIQLLFKDESISRAYFRAAEGLALNPQVRRLEEDADVESVEIEVLRGVVGRR